MQPGNIGLGDLKFKKHRVNVIYGYGHHVDRLDILGTPG